MKYIDMHNHGHELDEETLLKFRDDYILVIVSDDLETSLKTLELSRKYGFIKSCIGIHPWSIGEASIDDLNRIVEIVDKEDIRCLGEVGLDTRFVAKTIDKQRLFFQKFLELAREYDLLLNLHTAGTWREVFDLLVKYDIDRAYFHWYTGPLGLIDEIADKGYYIGANPAWKIQEKHRRVLEYAPLDIIVTESDAPYKYRGLEMSPELIRETIEYLADLKGLSTESIRSTIYRNYLRLYR